MEGKRKRGSRLRALAASLIVVACSAPPAYAQGSDAKAVAKEHFERGYELYKEGNFEAALVEFRRAYEVSPNPAVLYNIAQVASQMKDYAEALHTFERYLEEGGSSVSASRRQEVDLEIAKLKRRVGRATISTNVSGAEVFVDDELVGETPLDAPVILNAGKSRVRATKEGYAPASRVLEVAGQDELDVSLSLTALQPTTDEDGDDEEPFVTVDTDAGPSESDEGDLLWVPWALTGAFAVATGVTGAIALGESSNLASLREDAPASATELEDAEASTRGLAIATDILLGATVITGGIALYLTLSSDDESAVLVPTPGGATFRARF